MINNPILFSALAHVAKLVLGEKWGGKAILNEQRGGAIVFFWYKDKGESYDSARFMRRYI